MKLEKFQEKLSSASDIEERDPKGRTALFRAARLGRSEHVKLLLQHGADPNTIDSAGEAPLQAAARYGHLDCAGVLVDAGASLDYCPPPERTDFSESALCSAVRKAPDLVAFLLSCGADPSAASSARRLPLVIAAEQGSVETVESLLAANSRIDEQDSDGRTALHAAIDAGSVPLVKTLLARGADPEIEADYEGSALCAAVLNYETDRAALVLALLPSHPNFSAVCPSWNMTPIELAREFELTEVEELLVLAGSQRPKVESSNAANPATVWIDTETGSNAVGIHVGSGTRPEPSPQDRVLAQKVCEAKPTLYKRYGWRFSLRHWNILSSLAEQSAPIPLARVAYFVRGFLNAPRGQELLDGPELLGESYRDAINRFIEERLVAMISDTEAITLGSSASDLKGLAREHGVKVSGTKRDLVARIASQVGLDKLSASIPPEPHFVIQPEGRAVLEERQQSEKEAKNRLRRELLDLLSDGEFQWACFMARDLGRLIASRAELLDRIRPQQFSGHIAMARKTLEAPLPAFLKELSSREDRLRCIAAAVSLIWDKDNDWKIWGFDPQLKSCKAHAPFACKSGDAETDADPVGNALSTPTQFRDEVLREEDF